MIDAVTFDVWETMIHDDSAIADQRSKLRLTRMNRVLRRAGCHFEFRALRESYHSAWHAYERIWHTGRDVDTPEQVKIVLAPLGIDPADLSDEAFASLQSGYVDPIFDLPPALNEGLLDVLVGLRAKMLKLGLVCNTGRTPGSAMRRFFSDRGMLDYFDAVAFSNEENIRKPDPEIFHRVLRKLAVSPGHGVHIGDNIIADISGAKKAGMRAIQMHTAYSEKAPVGGVAPAEPDYRINRLPELFAALAALGGPGQ